MKKNCQLYISSPSYKNVKILGNGCKLDDFFKGF